MFPLAALRHGVFHSKIKKIVPLIGLNSQLGFMQSVSIYFLLWEGSYRRVREAVVLNTDVLN